MRKHKKRFDIYIVMTVLWMVIGFALYFLSGDKSIFEERVVFWSIPYTVLGMKNKLCKCIY